jgi:hypothetical protein
MNTEQKTIIAMMKIYCQHHHNTKDKLCGECEQLQEYAFFRLQKCPFAKDKPTCANCTVHCYEKIKRNEIKLVMRFSGPRMLFKHPILTLQHYLVGFKQKKRA